MPPANIQRLHTPRTAATVLGEIRAHDIGDVCDQLWANAFGTVAGAPSGLSPSVSGKAAHQLSQENNREAGGANNAPASNHD